MGFLSKVTQIGQRKTASQVVVQPEAPKANPASPERPRQVQQAPRYGKTCARCGTYFVADKMNETMCHWCGRNWSPSLQALSE
jgi:formamidopyrimidine-DNA glycosylase